MDANTAALEVPSTFLDRLPPETGMVGARMRIGNRLYATLDRVRGSTSQAHPAAHQYVRGWQRRAFGSSVQMQATRSMGSVGKRRYGSIRWRIGNRIYATLDRASGFYPRKATCPPRAGR
jgi:hypothetical protein